MSGINDNIREQLKHLAFNIKCLNTSVAGLGTLTPPDGEQGILDLLQSILVQLTSIPKPGLEIVEVGSVCFEDQDGNKFEAKKVEFYDEDKNLVETKEYWTGVDGSGMLVLSETRPTGLTPCKDETVECSHTIPSTGVITDLNQLVSP